MSSNAPMREIAQRTFAAEFNDASYTFRESDDDRAPVLRGCSRQTALNRLEELTGMKK